jgi:segregation and condensation protein A
MEAESRAELGEVQSMLDDRVLEAMGEREAKVMNHLLFHKSIIREPNERELDMDNYLRIMRELDMGIQVVLNDPVDRAIAIAFQLVIDEKFDPWNIDLGEFTKLYLEKLKKEEEVNFIIAGRLIVMAWSILKSQSANILNKADKVDEPADEPFFSDWEVEPVYEQAPGSGFSDFVLGNDSMITEAVHSTDVRPVTLMSLLEAFDEAREEIALRDRVKRLGKNGDTVPIIIADKLHGESLQEDISATWQRICRCQGDKIPISQVWNGHDTFDVVTVFISSLFLAKMEKIEIEQQKLPYGEIYVRNIEARDMAPMENVVMIPVTPTENLAVV